MFKYVLKRLVLMLFTFFCIMSIVFILVKLIEPPPIMDPRSQDYAIRKALGYDKPILVQYGIFLKNILTKWEWGVSFKIQFLFPVGELIAVKLPPTVLINIYSMIVALPIGIGLGIFAALKKNKWQDHVISTGVMIFISVPVYVYAFILQYSLGMKWDLLPYEVRPLSVAGDSWFSFAMFKSMILPILASAFGIIAGLTRGVRAELTEVLTSDFMLLARTKGLTRGQATVRHGLKNAMVPILPGIISMFVGVLSGSIILERIFNVPGIGSLFLEAVNLLDYNVIMATGMFYTFIGLAAGILLDLSYGFLDPRIRVGGKKQ